MENSLKLLMIDDNPDDALLIRRTLFSYPGQSAPGDPIELVHAESIALGIEHCQRDNIDLVLLDLSLSESRGIETLREFLRYAGAVPVIVLTGLADEQTGLEALNQGAQDYLVKGSIDRSILLRSIRHSIERNRLRRDLEKSLLNRAERLQSEVQSCKALDTMKDEFVHTVSHELRTPLSIIKEGMSLIADQIPGAINDKQRELLQGVQENIDRLGRIINDLLDISKIEAGKVKIEKQPLDICRLIREVIVPFDRRAHKRGLAVTCKLPVESLTLYADSDRLVQAFTNLINNALKFTREGGVVVSLRNEADRVTCVVEDTGIGIAEKDLPKVFGKFQQFGRVPGSGEKGTGLGLSIVKGIIELHGGSIKVASEMGKGTRFTFTIPKANAEEVLLESIQQGIDAALRQQGEFSVFVVRFTEYEALERTYGQDNVQAYMFGIEAGLRSVVRSGEFVRRRSRDEIVVMVEAGRGDTRRLTERFRRAIKSVVVNPSSPVAVRPAFSYGWCTCEGGITRASQMLDTACRSMVSDRQERLTKYILLVEDEPVVREAISRMLASAGYRHVGTAQDGQEALERLREGLPDLIILDMKMPRMNGYELIGRLKENVETKDIPLIIISGKEVEVERLKGYTGRKAIPLLRKPLDMETLTAALEDML